ncbi:MAG: (2Fe-2S)-binding protein [Clostridiales Family XIII bacterium]|jgi:carbon-monoxide dehydrogenase small subunit|nr:(2Fe-2S)-binding protein [Clostridiales Family XIII bacterium]
MKNEIRFFLNEKEVVYTGSATARLLDVLRNEFELTGVKCGCKEGECGACCVLLNDQLVNSCMVAMGFVDGGIVVTIEGYRKTNQFRVLDKAFATTAAVQCGYCIPGMILAAESILSRNPHPTAETIREGISGNLCRCTGYNAIVKAIEIAANEGEGLW